MDNILSYATFLKNRDDFRSAGTRRGADFNYWDTPSHKFFKILFYFWNSDTDDNLNHSGGLLAPTWEIYNDNGSDKYMNYDSAWAYLKNNDENERAEKLEQFVTLLSNINSESPWYFTEVNGLSEAMNRQVSPEFKVEDERRKISIKCLPDAFDNRIETLLSLYRDITWSWHNKREIIPANLRKFDMAIYIWESPIYAMNTNSVLDEKSDKYSSSYRLIEFHNCEIDYNSFKSGYDTLTTKEGVSPEFTIDIFFDDYYEHSYNSLMMRTIGDVIQTDTATIVYGDVGQGSYDTISVAQGEEFSKYNSEEKIFDNDIELTSIISEAETREQYWLDDSMNTDRSLMGVLKGHKGSSTIEKGFVGNMVDQVKGKVVGDVKSALNKLMLGNLYTYSISRMSDQIKSALNGDVFSVMNTIDEYAGTNIMNSMHNYSLGSVTNDLQQKLNNKVHDRREGSTQSASLGKIYEHSEPQPQAGRPYTNSMYDRMEPQDSIGGDMFPPVSKEYVKSIGNIYKRNTLINNI